MAWSSAWFGARYASLQLTLVAVALSAEGGEVLLVPAVGVLESAVVGFNIEDVVCRASAEDLVIDLQM